MYLSCPADDTAVKVVIITDPLVVHRDTTYGVGEREEKLGVAVRIWWMAGSRSHDGIVGAGVVC
jgi:hypothetical protein